MSRRRPPAKRPDRTPAMKNPKPAAVATGEMQPAASTAKPISCHETLGRFHSSARDTDSAATPRT